MKDDDIGSIISLEDMKKIMNKSIENSETWEDFYTEILIGVYKLGLERGKITSSSKDGETIDADELERENSLFRFKK